MASCFLINWLTTAEILRSQHNYVIWKQMENQEVEVKKKLFWPNEIWKLFVPHLHQSFLGHMYATANNGWELSLFFALCTIIRIVARCIGNPPWESLTPDFICCCQCKLIPSSVINESKFGFSCRKNHFLGWLTFYRLGWDVKNFKSTFWTRRTKNF